MDSVDLEVLKSSVRWLEAGHRAMLVTVVKTWGSSPRPEGAMLVVRDDGLVGAGNHGHAGMRGGMRVGTKRVDREIHPVACAQDLEGRGGLGAGQQAELQPHRLGLHQRGHVLHFGHRHLAADPPHPVGKLQAAGHASFQ